MAQNYTADILVWDCIANEEDEDIETDFEFHIVLLLTKQRQKDLKQVME